MADISENIISVSRLAIGYRSRRGVHEPVQSGITVQVKHGEMVAVIGRNGTGKSTLIRTLAGLQAPLAGEIFLSGKSLAVTALVERAKMISYVSTDLVHISRMKVFDIVALGRSPHTGWFGKLSRIDHDVVMEALKAVGLMDKTSSFIDEVSDGERQRALIARALAQDTGIILLDEPTAFLDITFRHEITSLLNRISRDGNKTIVFSTHDLQVAMAESDRIWLLGNNEFIEGAPEDLVLNGSLSRIFEQHDLVFDRETGGFVIRKEPAGEVFIGGSSEQEVYWTARAMERLGYSISKDKRMHISITVGKEEDKLCWKLQKKSQIIQVNSIYELSLHLRNMSN